MEKLITKAEVERTDKGLLAIASTGVEDRHGEKVSVDGWDLKNYKKNPVLQWAHNHEIPAVGIADKIKVEGTGKTARLTFVPIFHTHTPEARALKAMYEGTDEFPPILNSFSVGFRPKDMDGKTYTSQELLEISAVNVPANPEARVMAYKSLEGQGFDKEVIKSVVGEPEEPEVDELAELKAQLEQSESEKAALAEQLKSLVKVDQTINPQGRNVKAESRLHLAKAVVRATDKLLGKEVLPQESKVTQLKVIKRAAEKLIVNDKEELKNGSN